MRNATATDDLLSVAQVAEVLGKAPRTVLYRIALGQIAATKLGTGKTSAYVITRAELDRLTQEPAA